MKKFLKYFAILFLSLGIILLIIPSFISLESYKGLAAEKVKEITGRDLKINGNITFALLPTPTIKIKSVILSSLEEHSNPLLDVQEISASISLWSLLKGSINISAIDIYKPIVNLEYLKNGSASWEFSPNLPVNVNNTAPNSQLIEKSPKNNEQLAIKIGSIKLFNGKVNYSDLRNNTNSPITIDIDNLEIKHFQGPANIACQFYSSGKNYSLEGDIYEKQDSEARKIISAKANLTVLKEKIIVSGDLERDNMSFIGKLNLVGNAKNLQDIVPALKILNEADHVLTMNMKGDKKSLSFSDINLSSGKILANGNVNLSLADNQQLGPLDLKIKLNPGNIDISVSPIIGYNNLMSQKLSIASASLKPLFAELAVDGKDIPAQLLNKPFSFSTFFVYREQELSLNDINFNIAQEASLKGDLGVKNWQKNMVVTYNLQASKVSSLASLFAITLPVNIEYATLKGQTSQEGDLVKTNNSLIFAKTTNNIKGVISLGKSIKANMNIDNLTIESSGTNLGGAINELTKSSASKPLGNYNLLAQLQGDITKSITLKIDRFAVVFKGHNTELKGDVVINLLSPKPEISADIKITSLNLNDLASNQVSTAAGNKANIQGANTSHSAIPWSKENIDLTFLKQYNGHLTLNIQKIIKGDLVFDTINTNMTLANGILNIKNFNGKLYGGALEATGQISSLAEQAVSVTAKLSKADLRNIIKQEGKIKVTKGTIDFVADINTSGHSQLHYINNLKGNASLTALDGSISGFDLQKTLNAFKKTKNLEDILRILDTSFSGGETAFQNLIVATEIKAGIASIVQGKLVADQSEITATGNVNLPQYSCDVESHVALDIKKSLPPFKVRFYGNLNNIQHQLDTRLLQQYLLKNVLNEVMEGATKGKKPEEMLKNLIGIGKNKDSDQEQNNPEPNNQQPLPADNNPMGDLKKIGKELKGLFK